MKFAPKTKEEAKALLKKSGDVGWSRLEQIMAAAFLYFFLCWAVFNVALVAEYFLVGPIIWLISSLFLTICFFAMSFNLVFDSLKLLLENIDQVPISDKSREKVRAIMDVKPETASSTL